MKSALLSIATVLVLVSGCGSSSSDFLPDAGITVRPGESIQAAVDAAAPGDTITVLPGDYVETADPKIAVHVTKPLKLIGKSTLPNAKVRILPSPGQRQGILVEPAKAGDPDIDGIEIKGFTVEGFPNNGIWLRHTNNFNIEGNESINNLENGIWPTLSANGQVKKNVAYGSRDSALWVEAAENVRIVENDLSQSPTGLEITVSNDIFIERNNVHDNVVGIGLYHPSGAGLPPQDWPPSPFRNWQVKDNDVHDNNLKNPVSGGLVGELPPGGGILILGVDDVLVENNRLERNNFFGAAMIDYCVAVDGSNNSCEKNPPYYADTAPDHISFISNNATTNGNNPPPGPFKALAGDLLGLGGKDNCASDNITTKVVFAPELPPC
jgi:parallel beta-helix repeat protein